MSDWIHALPVGWMAVMVFGVTYLAAAAIHVLVTALATGDRARAFKGVSPGLLPPLGILFGLLVAFVAAQVWADLDRPAPRSTARDVEWPAMARRHASLTVIPTPLAEDLQSTVALSATGSGQLAAQREIVAALENALDARRQRILVSRTEVNGLKWTALILQAVCTLLAIAMVHSDNRVTSALALGLFSTALAVCVLLILAHDRPFTGQVAVRPDALLQVMPSRPSAPR